MTASISNFFLTVLIIFSHYTAINGQLCATHNSYCIFGETQKDYLNGEYNHAGTDNGCTYFSNSNNVLLHFNELLNSWILSSSLNDITGYASCYSTNTVLDQCTSFIMSYTYINSQNSQNSHDAMDFILDMQHRCPLADNETYAPTPQPTPTAQPTPSPINPTVSSTFYSNSSTKQQSSNATAPIIISVVVIIIVVIFCIKYAIIKGKEQQKQQYNNPNQHVANIETKKEKEKEKAKANQNQNEVDVLIAAIAPSAPPKYEDVEDVDGEKEGMVIENEGQSEIKQWFNSAINIPEETEKYHSLFIAFGYDNMSFIKEITDKDLVQMGITKLAHRNRIMLAVRHLNSN